VCRKFQSKGCRNIFDPRERFFQKLRVHPPGVGTDSSLYVVNIGRKEFSARIYAVVKRFDIDHKEYGGVRRERISKSGEITQADNLNRRRRLSRKAQ